MAITKTKPAAAGHTAGIFADMSLDGPEVGTLVAVIDRAKNLPNRKTMGKQDPYCAMRLGKEAKKTDTDRRGGQTPKWDQELRFTVHDSPDYYKLKCSIFNDDKKTDLIGEAWIDLTDLIKPGGGSNDLWHQLNYKGKYAGDVRIELTYYDLRPREEKAPEKKKSRETTPVPTEANKSESAPRQLGPRDVRRRPLPASPASLSPAPTLPIAPPKEEAQLPPPPPPKIPLNQPVNNHVIIEQQQRIEPQYPPEPYEEEYSAPQLSLQHYRQPFCEDFSPTAEYEHEPMWPHAQDQPSPYQIQKLHSAEQTPLSESPHSWSDQAEIWDHSDHSALQPYGIRDEEQYPSSQTSLNSGAHQRDLVPLPIKPNTSPTRPSRYRDSPLRHSVNQGDAYAQMYEEPESFDEPPPPPMHRDTPPRRPQPEYPPSSYPQFDQAVIPFAPNPLDVASRRRSIDDRNALQRIEYDYNAQSGSQVWPHENQRRRSFDAHTNDHNRYSDYTSNDNYEVTKRMSSYNEYQNDTSFEYPRGDSNREVQHYGSMPGRTRQQPPHWQRSGSYDERRLSGNPATMSDYDSRMSSVGPQLEQSQTAYYKPQPIRPKPATSSPNQIPLRKAVSTELYRPQDERRLSTDPYGPEAYDVLNPVSSPVTNEGNFQSAKQTRESARMREADKHRDHGPIIGNDGREIDPSDHLPTDTWAPEPERKSRRPEHVIHFRTKNDNRSSVPIHASPMPSKTSHQRQLPSQPTYPPPSTSSPNNGRNKLQKPSPTRPQPTPPYQNTSMEVHSNRYMPPHPMNDMYAVQLNHPQAHQDLPPTVHRPQLSEYQVPASNSYQPRGYQNNYGTHSNANMQTGKDYGFRNSKKYDDPLAAEMSMIDIGPARGGQMVLSRRAY